MASKWQMGSIRLNSFAEASWWAGCSALFGQHPLEDQYLHNKLEILLVSGCTDGCLIPFRQRSHFNEDFNEVRGLRPVHGPLAYERERLPGKPT